MKENEKKIHFGEKMREFARIYDVPYKELYKYLGFDSQSSLSRIFGEEDFHTKYLRKASEIFGIEMIDFFENEKVDKIVPQSELIENLKNTIEFLQSEIREKNDIIAKCQQSNANLQMNFADIQSSLKTLSSK